MPINPLNGRFRSVVGAAITQPAIVVLTLAVLGGTGYAAAVFPRDAAAPPINSQVQDAAALSPEQAKDFAAAWAQQNRVDLGVAPEGAKVVIVKFNDYQCGGC